MVASGKCMHEGTWDTPATKGPMFCNIGEPVVILSTTKQGCFLQRRKLGWAFSIAAHLLNKDTVLPCMKTWLSVSEDPWEAAMMVQISESLPFTGRSGWVTALGFGPPMGVHSVSPVKAEIRKG